MTGKKLSQQAWGIVPKIGQVDQLLRVDQRLRDRVLEVHPEILFWALNGRAPMKHRKSKAEGFEERLQVLERYVPNVRVACDEALSRWPRSKVARDDVLDAFAASLCGRAGERQLRSIPEEPPVDDLGLPMRMVFWVPDAITEREGRGRSGPRFEIHELADYAARYDTDADAPIEHLMARSIRELSYPDFLELVAWKSPRPLPRARENSADFVRAVTAASLSTSNERFRIESLTLLRGVGWPTASVIVHLCSGEDYPILDFRALWSLGIDEPSEYRFEFWWDYVRRFRELMAATGLSARGLDRALWQYSKEHQPERTQTS